MVSSLLDKILRAGEKKNFSPYLKNKVIPSNAITLILLFGIAIPFIFITLLFLPPQLAIFPTLGAVVCIGVWLANLMGLIYWSRIIICTLPIILGAIYNAYLSGPQDPPIPSLYLIELSFTLIPFVVYDLRERGFLLFTSSINALIILGFPFTKELFVLETSSTMLREGWLSNVAICMAIICNLSLIYGLAFLNKQNERKTDKLFGEMEEKNTVLQLSQKELELNLQKVEAAQADERKRQWASEGLTQLNELLRTGKEAQVVFDQVVGHLVRYTKANQAGLFLVKESSSANPQDASLKLTACYAYNRKKFVARTIEAGEGLLGQCYLEQEYIYMTDVPQNYIQITSGLGQATPTSLLLMPLKVNESIEGILELAAFHQLQPYEIDFLSKAAESIASYVQNNRINEKTTNLLTETLKQAQALQATEEELRQNLEELAATQEEIHRKEKEYLRRIQELEVYVHRQAPNTQQQNVSVALAGQALSYS